MDLYPLSLITSRNGNWSHGGSSPSRSTTGSYGNLTLSEGMRMVKHGSIGCTTGELSARYKKIGGSLYYLKNIWLFKVKVIYLKYEKEIYIVVM